MTRLYRARPNNPRYKPIKSKVDKAAYRAALRLVARIDEDLRLGVKHYRTRTGRLLTTLDEVVRVLEGQGND